jgi:RNA methyltransferase, TrmH family
VQDPGDLGTLLRTAAAFGWQAVWLLPGCCDPFNDKAVRASKGATFKVPLVQGDWEQLQQVGEAAYSS